MKAARMLRSARQRAGMTQRALATAAGVPQPTVARIETGTVSPRADTLERLLRATRHSLEIEPLLGIGVDRTAIRERLRLTPAERIQLAVEEVLGMPRLRVRK